MIAVSAKKFVEPLEAFEARCDARALLVRECLMELHEAVDGLQQAAAEYGLVAALGQDYVQAVMAEAFGSAR